MSSINFKANFIRNTNIQQIGKNNASIPKEVAIVELDIKQAKDVATLKSVADDWDRIEQGYSKCIYYDATKNFQLPDRKEHYYAVTLQKENHKDLQPQKILGLAMYSHNKDSNNILNWLQVNPETNYNNSRQNNRFFKNIGRALVNFIKETSDKTISVYSDSNAISFYEKLGFAHKNGKSMSMYFSK